MNYVIQRDELYHHGILGQKWGVRRFQNEDGTRIKKKTRSQRILDARQTMADYNSNVKELEKIAGLLMKGYADIEAGNSKYNANDLEQKYYEQREKVNSMTQHINANKIQQTASLKTGKEICNKVLAYAGATAVIAGLAVGTAVLGDKLNSIT